jgi:hypothetical protein
MLANILDIWCVISFDEILPCNRVSSQFVEIQSIIGQLPSMLLVFLLTFGLENWIMLEGRQSYNKLTR